MKRIIAVLALTASLAGAASASAATHAGCQDLGPNRSEFCGALGHWTHFQLSGIGKFTVQLPYGPQVTAHYVSYRNWQAYTTGPGRYGRPVVVNVGCCFEYYWDGWVW